MKANKILVSLLTLVLTVALMFSLFSVSVFAEDASSTTGSSSSTTTDDHAGHDHDDEKEETNIVETIISLSIVGVVLIAVAVYCIVKKEKVAKFFRAIKSEMKKIVWFSWKDTRKNSIVVIVAVVIIAAFIGLLDLVFNNGVDMLYKLFN